MNVNSTTKVDAATTVSIPSGVFIANAQQVFSWTKRGSARVIQWIQMFLNRCLITYWWLLCFILSPFKIYKNSLVFSKIYWSHRNKNFGHKPRHKLHYRHLTFIAEIDRCYLDNPRELFENFWHKLKGTCSFKVLHCFCFCFFFRIFVFLQSVHCFVNFFIPSK